MTLADVRAEHLRLAILRLLEEEDGDYPANESILTDALQRLRLGVNRDQVKSEIKWLAEQRLVTKEEVLDLVVATITDLGLEVARGHRTVPGVKRPSRRR